MPCLPRPSQCTVAVLSFIQAPLVFSFRRQWDEFGFAHLRGGSRAHAEAVAMLELEHTCEQIGNRGERDVRVWPHVDPMTRRELLRPHVVEENERAHH